MNLSPRQPHRALVTGALGQIGTELVPALRERYGIENVVASDVRVPPRSAQVAAGPFERLDCTRLHQIQEVVRQHRITTVYHLAGLLSAVAEDRPQVAWDVNTGGLYRMLEVARQYDCALFFPSSIGAFGPQTPKHAPQDTIQRPTSMYGISKVTGELLCDYYFHRFGVDTRGLRLPGIISYTGRPGGGTTDYAVEIFHEAVRHRHYTCFLRPDTACEMMYMPDAVRAIIELMEAEPGPLVHRNAYNLGAMSFTPIQLATEIRKHIPAFVIDYDVDPVRQSIADSWPDTLDDSAARSEWGWRPQYDVARMTGEMLTHLRVRIRGILESE